jgi:type IV secretory pathway VirB10-like protein
VGNSARASLYALHCSPSGKNFDFIVEFPLGDEILGLASLPDPSEPEKISVYCVQTKTVQRFALKEEWTTPPNKSSYSVLKSAATSKKQEPLPKKAPSPQKEEKKISPKKEAEKPHVSTAAPAIPPSKTPQEEVETPKSGADLLQFLMQKVELGPEETPFSYPGTTTTEVEEPSRPKEEAKPPVEVAKSIKGKEKQAKTKQGAERLAGFVNGTAQAPSEAPLSSHADSSRFNAIEKKLDALAHKLDKISNLESSLGKLLPSLLTSELKADIAASVSASVEKEIKSVCFYPAVRKIYLILEMTLKICGYSGRFLKK